MKWVITELNFMAKRLLGIIFGRRGWLSIALAISSLCAADSWAQSATEEENVHNLNAIITGNQEQPKVLYIVPWKTAFGDAGIPYRPISGQTDTVFRHVERHEHQRQVEFLRDLSASDREDREP
jgi:hypothetical protein